MSELRRMRSWLVAALAALVWGATACGGHVYDPDVDGQSHWWRTCKSDTECGAGLTCECGACTKACDESSACAGTSLACIKAPSWCESRASAVCAAECERASDCPYDGRCENAACVPLPERASSDTADAASALDAGCVASECDAGTREDAASTCGDGILQPENSESCDDGNFVDGDGCASNCTVEDTDSCGDNLLQSFEACDDGNLVDGDGCSDNCAIEPGYTCAPSGAPCFSETP